MKKFLAIALSALFLCSCGGGNKNQQAAQEGELTGEVQLSGAFALYPLAVKWAEEFQVLHPGVRIDVQAGGAGKGITDALAEVVDFGMVSRELYQPEIDNGALGFAVAKDAVVATINAENPVIKDILAHGITAEDATKIWITGEAKYWGDILGNGDKTPIHVYTRSDACGAAETWAMWFGKKQEDLQGTAIYSDPGLAAAIQKDPCGIGLNNIGYAYDSETHKPNPGLKIAPIDADGDGKISQEEYFYDTKDEITKAIALDKYPSPPARDLYLVSKGVPKNPAALEFLKYVLSKDGQSKNEPTGYISMSDDKIQKALSLLK